MSKRRLTPMSFACRKMNNNIAVQIHVRRLSALASTDIDVATARTQSMKCRAISTAQCRNREWTSNAMSVKKQTNPRYSAA